MTRTIEVEMAMRTTNVEKAISKFFQKHPEIEYWRETFEYMADNGEDFFCDNLMGDGTRNRNWAYALHLDIEDNHIYMCVIERA